MLSTPEVFRASALHMLSKWNTTSGRGTSVHGKVHMQVPLLSVGGFTVSHKRHELVQRKTLCKTGLSILVLCEWVAIPSHFSLYAALIMLLLLQRNSKIGRGSRATRGCGHPIRNITLCRARRQDVFPVRLAHNDVSCFGIEELETSMKLSTGKDARVELWVLAVELFVCCWTAGRCEPQQVQQYGRRQYSENSALALHFVTHIRLM
jgi:hypothetical protein